MLTGSPRGPTGGPHSTDESAQKIHKGPTGRPQGVRRGPTGGPQGAHKGVHTLRHAQDTPKDMRKSAQDVSKTAPRRSKQPPEGPQVLRALKLSPRVSRIAQKLPRRQSLLSRPLSGHFPDSKCKQTPLSRCFRHLRCAAVLAQRLTISGPRSAARALSDT